MSHALITGGCGFIGAHLSKALLEEGYKVTACDNFRRGRKDALLHSLMEYATYSIHECDLTIDDSLNPLPLDVTHIFHCAAIVGVANVVAAPAETLSLNSLALQHTINWAQSLPRLERFIFFSTSEVYSFTPDLLYPTPETTKLTVPPLDKPRSTYALSKIYGEALCSMSGLPFTIVRPHNIYGPRMGYAHVIPELSERIREGAQSNQTVEVYSPDHQRAFCYIDDAVNYLIALVENPKAQSTTVNLGNSDEETSCWELGLRIRDFIDSSVKLTRGLETPGSPSRRVPDTHLLKSLTHTDTCISLEEGLERTLRWYQDVS